MVFYWRVFCLLLTIVPEILLLKHLRLYPFFMRYNPFCYRFPSLQPYRRMVLLLLFMAVQGNLHAQALPLMKDMYEKDTRAYAKIWIDKGENLTYSTAIQKLRTNQFRTLDSLEIPGMFRWGAYTYWIAVAVRNPDAASFPLLLNSVRLSDDSTWHLKNGSPPIVKKLSTYGENDPYGFIPYTLRWSWIYPIEPQATDTILIKYYNFKPTLNFPPTASDARIYAAKRLAWSLKKHWYFILGCGALFSVFVFAFSIWLYVREISFFWYAAFCFSLLIVSCWNFDSEIPPLYFLSNYVEWTYTKLHIHTLFPAVCHSLFLYHFFRNQSNLLDKVVRWVLWTCAVAAGIETVFLTLNQLHWSWVFYWWFRIFIAIFGLLILYFIQKIPGKESKWIIRGALSIYVFDILSNFYSQYSSQITLVGLIIDVFCFTIATVTRFNRIQVEKHQLLLAQQTREMEQKLEIEKIRITISHNIRNEVASDLHDDLGTTLSSISFLGEMAAIRLQKKDQPVGPILERIISQSREMAQTMRGALWIINPQSDSFLDLCQKIRSFAEEVLRSRQINLSFQLMNPAYDCTLSLEIQRNLFLICKEVIVNISRHSGATEATFHTYAEPSFIEMRITDNGSGFDICQSSEGNGLRNIVYRAEQIGGNLDLCSKPNEGTSIRLLVPMNL